MALRFAYGQFERPRGLDMSCDHVNLSKKAKLFEMEALVTDLSLDLKERLFVKLRDSNRTLASLTAERVKKVCVDGVHSAVFDATFPELPRHCRLRDLSSLTSLFPLQSLVRFHHSGDFCLVCPVSQCSESVPAPHLMSMLSTASITPPPWLKDDFAVRSGQLLLPLARHGQSTFFQVAIPIRASTPTSPKTRSRLCLSRHGYRSLVMNARSWSLFGSEERSTYLTSDEVTCGCASRIRQRGD